MESNLLKLEETSRRHVHDQLPLLEISAAAPSSGRLRDEPSFDIYVPLTAKCFAESMLAARGFLKAATKMRLIRKIRMNGQLHVHVAAVARAIVRKQDAGQTTLILELQHRREVVTLPLPDVDGALDAQWTPLVKASRPDQYIRLP